ncbi:BadM/Rrf2 family transcriptional regulator [Novosphingobium sp. PhB57]|uniref:RrF2 family transcriptional regulator n=1 Tax=Novosphingobium sp. PhB57 TaxID=2485107 RepID=UPI0010486FB7|nr:Rrf2 family transcriptional regulator [Novosphingobium sp. PhB57]TCU58706.1 BadM/Rrf2 family transcriptional regulator [Novosphingobium sp. PhB57]
MNLKNQVEWALHCCSVMASLPEGRYLSTRSLSEFHGVPKEYLGKALQGLSKAGLVHTTLGPSGGYRLARPAQAITFLEVVEAVEGRKSTFQCSEIRANNPCRPKSLCDDKPCAVARIMWRADEAWRQTLAAVTLADLQETLQEDVPADLLKRSFDWLMERAG